MMNGRHMRLLTLLAIKMVASKAWPQMPFSLDASFQTSIFSSYVSSIGMMSDESLLLSGRINFTPDPLQNNLGSARLFLDGNRDDSFPTFPLTNGGGKITPWVGQYYVIAGQTVRRLLPNGFLDNTFAEMESDPYFSSLQAGDYHVFPDGRVLFAGTFLLDDTARDFVGPYRLAWFSNTGYLDTTRVHRQANGSILAITEDAQGRFLLSGFVNSYEGQSVGRIFRALPDGAFDPSFVAPLDPFGYSFKIRELGDGRILGVGRYKVTGVSDTLGVVRLMADGSLDPSFIPVRISMQDGPLGLVPNVQDAHILADGRMIIGGRFDHINGVARGAIAMLNADGSLSDDYFTGPGCGDYSGIEVNYRYIAGIVPAPNGEYYIHGAYMGYDDGTTNYPQQGFVSRLHGFNVGVREQSTVPLQLQPNPTYGPLTVALPANIQAQDAEVLDAHGRVVWREALREQMERAQLDLSELSEGAYVLRLRMPNGAVRNGRFVVVK